jgi:hypothetical protein
VAEQAKGGADGLKLLGLPPRQLNVAWNNVLVSARLGLTTMEHWYGLPEALFGA